jgi:hypothetical protein
MPLSKAQIANSGHLFAGCSQKKAMAKVTVSSPYNATQEISGDSKRYQAPKQDPHRLAPTINPPHAWRGSLLLSAHGQQL